MDIIKMPLEINLITYDVIPEAFLPELHLAGDTNQSFVVFGEVQLHRLHDLAEVAVACRAEHDVKVLGQKDVTHQIVGMMFFGLGQICDQQVDVRAASENRDPSIDDLRDEDDCIGNVVSTNVQVSPCLCD